MKTALALLLVLAAVILPGCGYTEEALSPTPDTVVAVPAPTITSTAVTPVDSTTAPAAGQPANAITLEDIDKAKQVIADYWQAFNSYDIEGVLDYLEETFRQQKGAGLESDMGRMQAFGVKLGVAPAAEPAITPDGKIEIKIDLKTPIDTRLVTYRLTEVSGEWKICYLLEE
jgi:hypothetical protein